MQPWDRRDYRMPGGTPSSPKIAAALAVAPAVIAQKTRGLYPATQAILETMVEGAQVDYDTATRIESRKLARIMVGQTAKNMIQAFFFDQPMRSRSGPCAAQRLRGVEAAKRVGVLGAGMMGAGIAHANAGARHPLRAEGRVGREGRGRAGGDPPGHLGAGRPRATSIPCARRPCWRW